VTVTSPAPTHVATTAAQAVPPVHTTPVVITGAGWVRTFAAGNGKPITVDGHVIGTGGSTPAKTTCGKHAIAVGSGRAHTYNVPCNNSVITVGSPDGT
jgi:hypothetical protein